MRRGGTGLGRCPLGNLRTGNDHGRLTIVPFRFGQSLLNLLYTMPVDLQHLPTIG